MIGLGVGSSWAAWFAVDLFSVDAFSEMISKVYYLCNSLNS
jgi:hypothetical protein